MQGHRNKAGIAQLVERNLAKVEVASSSLVSRSKFQALYRGNPFGGMAEWLCSGLQSRVRRFDSDFRLHTIQAVSPYGGVAECLCDKGCNPYTGRLKSAPPPPRFTMPLCRALDIGIARMVK